MEVDFVITIVSNPEHKDEIKSFPARDVTIVLCAPDTAKSEKRHDSEEH